jgi:two-component system chemotaxis sensor kinase CheA
LASIMIGWFLVRRAAAHITSPLAQLTEATAALAAGDRTLRVSISSGDELEQLGVAFNQMVEELNESYVRLEGLNRTLEERVEARTRELAGRDRDLRLVLDTVNEGLMTVDLEGRLAQEHSAMIDRWFGPYSGATLLSDYLQPIDENFALFFQLAYEALRDDILPFEVNIAQFPSRLRHQERVFQFSYLPMFEAEQLSGLLVTVNDITAELALTRHEAEQRELLAVFEGLMRDRQLFLSFFDEASDLVEGIGAPDVSLENLRRLVHTLKGNASLASLNVVAEICHDIEDQIEQTQGNGADPTAKILVLRERWRMLAQSLRSFLGDRGRSTVEVEIGAIERLVDDLSRGANVGQLATRVAAWRCAPASRLFARLGDHARSLAGRLGRGDLIVEIDSDGVLIDPQRWAPVLAELIHLIRNAVDHGLEPSAQRAPLGKPVRPRLRLGAHLRPEGFLLEVEDDGKGLDWEAIRRAARRRGLPADSEAELLKALFTGGVSTRADVTATSGRGIGLAALHRRVQELGGHITVSSRPWVGTCWRLQFPSSSLAAHEGIGSGPEAAPHVGKVASA